MRTNSITIIVIFLKVPSGGNLITGILKVPYQQFQDTLTIAF